MKYQVPTNFAKLTFLCSLFPQVVISCLSSAPCQNARLSSAYCQIVNSTLPVLCCQLHIAKSSTPHHCIVNSTLWMLHCQLAKSNSFFRLPKCSSDHPKIILKVVCPMPKIHSLATQARFLWILFSIHLPNVPTYQPI
jgi:hypothetical protein